MPPKYKRIMTEDDICHRCRLDYGTVINYYYLLIEHIYYSLQKLLSKESLHNWFYLQLFIYYTKQKHQKASLFYRKCQEVNSKTFERHNLFRCVYKFLEENSVRNSGLYQLVFSSYDE